MEWAKSPEVREQMTLFSDRLDDAIGQDHNVRLLDDIMHQLDWSKWEVDYDLTRGQPPIHPRVLASVILYGLLTRIRTTRALEEAVQVRLDFRWLVEGRSIDHTTVSKFRRRNAEALKNTFVQVGLIARQMGCLPLETLAFDGTRLRASNRRSGTRTPAELREMKEALATRFADLESKIAAADAQEDEVFGEQASHTLSDELVDVERRRKQVNSALAEIEQIEQAGVTIPKRLPITDPQSRMLPNKEGGFAPNYTPLATVDVDSGLIVSSDVISDIDEGQHLIPAIEDVQEQFDLETPPGEVLADGMMATGENLAKCTSRGISLYSPLPREDHEQNPALRDDPSKPVAPEDRERLPKKTTKRNGKKFEQLEKQAFIYDVEQDCYWCPEGKTLAYAHTTTEISYGRRRERRRYKASADDCAVCPLRTLCLQGKAKQRTINREQYESYRTAHAEKMSTEEAREKYSRRRHPGERPFAVIKHQFGARRFLLRGINQVRQEWLWLSTAFNLHRLFGLIRSGVDPPQPQLQRN